MGDSHGHKFHGEVGESLRLAASGDMAAWAGLFESHRGRLKRIITARLDPRLKNRLDPSDVLQEASIEALKALPRYAEDPKLPLFLWLRYLAGRTLQILHRQHLDVQARAAGREIRLDDFRFPEATSAIFAVQLLGKETRPSLAVARAERKQRLELAMESLSPSDREILFLRHFEELTTEEAANVLGLERSAASKRYFRALHRLKQILEALPGGLDGFRL